MPETKLHVVHQANTRRHERRGAQCPQKLHTAVEVGEDDRLITRGLRQFTDTNDRLGDQAKVAFRAENRWLYLNTRRLTGKLIHGLELAVWRDHEYLLDDVFDGAITVTLHPAGVGGDPTTQRRKLLAVRLMAASKPLEAQLTL